jgi:Putative beta-barrel porin-2, OmpL-like. bbp2
MKAVHLLFLVSIITVSVSGQDSSSTKTLSISGYAEVYYQYDFNKPADGNRPGFIYSHNRHNEFNLNLGFVKAAYATDRVRANLAFATGTYMNANYAAEPGVLKNIFEANAGFKLSKKKNLWLDAGILPSHIGFESAISKDCWTLTRSMVAENSPYFEAGAKLTYITDNGKWLFSGMALNGWQRITRVSGNSLMSWGTQLQFKPSEKILMNYSTFIGTDKPDSARLSRIFHNIYGVFSLSRKAELTIGFDIGTEEKLLNSNSNNTWVGSVGILKYNITKKWAVAARAEYYTDKNEAIVSTQSPNGFQTTSYSFNLDHTPVKNISLRLEGRIFKSKDAIFKKETGFKNNNAILLSSIAINF